jgi:chromosome segregation ATPase
VFDTAESLLLEGQTPTVMGGLHPTWRGIAEHHHERAEILGEIQRLDSALDVAQGETRQVVENLDAERRVHEQIRAEVREARVIAAEREKSIQDKSEELRDAQRQLGEATAQSTRLEAELSHTRNDLKDGQMKVAKLREAVAGPSTERDTVKRDNKRLTREYERAQESAKQAKAALDAGAQKIGKQEVALEDEREARKIAEQAHADRRVEWATLTERAAGLDHNFGQRRLVRTADPTRRPRSVGSAVRTNTLTAGAVAEIMTNARAAQAEKLQTLMALRHPDSANPAG